MKETVVAELERLKKIQTDSGKQIAFQKAIDSIKLETRDLRAIDLLSIRGVGPSIARVVQEVLERPIEKEQEKTTPINSLLQIPGVSRSIVNRLQTSGIKSIEELEKRIQEGTFVNKQIEIGLEKLRTRKLNFALRIALQLANKVTSRLRSIDLVQNVSFVGSVRRESFLVQDINVLASCVLDIKEAIFSDLAKLGRVLEQRDVLRILYRDSALDVEIPIEIRLVDPKEWITSLFYYTGSTKFVARLRAAARQRGLVFNSHFLEKDNKKIVCSSEKELFENIGEMYVGPFQRRD